jgi:hypothetical protein
MPQSDLHQKKRQTNLTLRALIAGWIALIWIVTMVKMFNA